MDQKQTVEGVSNLEKNIETVCADLEYINNNIKGEFPEVPKDSYVLIFLGAFRQNFHTFYQHFQIQEVMLDTKYYKLIKLEKKGKKSYLLNFPLILQYDDETNEIPLDLCISKIYAEKALKKMKMSNFSLVVDMEQLKGIDEKAKVCSIISDQILYFGKFYFSKNPQLYLRQSQQDQWDQLKIMQINSNKKENEFNLNSQLVNSSQVLKLIFGANIYLKVEKINPRHFLNYGKMMSFLLFKEGQLTKQFNDLFKKFQKQLLLLQQMPIVQSNDDCIKKVGNYLIKIKDCIDGLENSNIDSYSQIYQVLDIINKINQSKEAKELNDRIQQKNSPQMKQFLQDNNINHIEQLSIQPYFNDQDLQKLNTIVKFFEEYFKSGLQNITIFEVQNLKINLKFWCQYCYEATESTLYDLKYIVNRIQEGPINQIENGIYFIGITRSGKTTIMNAIFNPEKLEKKKILGQQCYQIRQESQTQFNIGQGGVSKTQKISGIYIGQKEELNRIFYNQDNCHNINQQQQDVFSYQDQFNLGQNNQQLNLLDKWFMFDCPGFDDNQNELMRIAHRISLYNYFKKTKNIIVYFVIDISILQIQHIKNTFDPICCLLKNKNDILENFQGWTNLILTKAETDQRNEYLEQWDIAYNGQLEQNYGFYKQLFADNERCLEFLKPSEEIEKDIKKLTDSIIEKSKNQFLLKQCNPIFELQLDEKLWMLYQNCIPKIKAKLELILKLFLSNLDEYILQSSDILYKKREQVTKLYNILLNQQTNQITNEINLDNCLILLYMLSSWIKDNQHIQQIYFFLEIYIKDIETIFKISQYCQNNQNIVPFTVKIDDLVNKIKKILNTIEETEKIFVDMEYSGFTLGVSTFVAGFSILLNFLKGPFKVQNQQSFLFILYIVAFFSGSLKKLSKNTGKYFGLTEEWKNKVFFAKYNPTLIV